MPERNPDSFFSSGLFLEETHCQVLFYSTNLFGHYSLDCNPCLMCQTELNLNGLPLSSQSLCS